VWGEQETERLRMSRFDHLSKKELVQGITENRIAIGKARESLQNIQSGKYFPTHWAARDAFLQSTARMIEDLEVEYEKLVQELERRP
jgi:hypothetical protein